MTIGVLCVLLLLAFALALLAWRRCALTALGLALLVLFGVGCGPLPAWMLARLQSGSSVDAPVAWGSRTLIVLLGAGTVRAGDAVEPSLFAWGRIDAAAVLYRACREHGGTCAVELSGGDARATGQSEAAAYADALQRLGIDRADLLQEPRSMNTWQNAQFSAPLLKTWGADRVLLVSSGFHLRRGMLYFAHFGIRATPVRADYVGAVPSWQPLSYNFTMADLALHEYLGIARYHLYNAMGWNVQATKPGTL